MLRPDVGWHRVCFFHPPGAPSERRSVMPEDARRLPFEIDATIDPTLVTGRAGLPLVLELFRQLGVAATIDAALQIKPRQRGLRPSQLVESLIALWVAGGDRCQALTALGEDRALASLLGYALPAATTVRDFLEAFHADDLPLGQAGPQAAIPAELGPPPGLREAHPPPPRRRPRGGAAPA